MIIKVKKLFAGKVSIRGYEVADCMKKKEDIEIKFNEEIMLIPWRELGKGTTTGQIFTSRYGNKKYKLVDYQWKPQVSRQQQII